jgi:phosphonate transport system ATP-binding protein
MGARVESCGLSKSFPRSQRVLDQIDLVVEPGEIVALVGANGAGKSTLLRCLVRLLEPTSGRVHIGQAEVTRMSHGELRRLRSRVGFVFQRFHLVPRLDAFHNVLLGALGRSGPRGWWPVMATDRERAEAIACLDRVGLAAVAEQRADSLSGGQQQRVAIARMLMQKPEVVLADEPVASLDPAAGTAVMELLREIARERDLTVIAALHQLELARHYSDRLVGLRSGRLVLDHPTAEWRANAVAALYEHAAV